MPLFLTTAATFIAILVGASFLFSRLFPGSSSLDFESNDAYWANFMKKQLLCRELHVLTAIAVGVGTGLVQCYWRDVSTTPLLLAFATVEAVWLLLMFVVLPPKEQTYTNMPRFALAVVAGAAVGIFACLTLGVVTTPLTVAGVLFLLAWLALTPL
jgi:hypothetical protein